MKILAIADIHGDLGLVKKVEKLVKKEKVDLVLLGGDQTWFEQPVNKLVSPIAKVPTLMVHGNHEPESLVKAWEKMYPNVTNLHAKSFEKNGIGFFGTGTTDWGFKEDAKQIFKELKKGHNEIKNFKKKVMVSHGPPAGSKIELMGFPGSYGVRKAMDKFKPDYVICGHIHEGGGIIEKIGNSKVVNVARKPFIFEI
ncbi:MAG: metallophosphoesterase [Nanoarchaeota archaeon]|nr:metallophosphoesterase [Nanoarchaeota archaeon]